MKRTKRLVIYITEQENSALNKLAERERRHPSDQVAVIVVEELLRQGLLNLSQSDESPTPPKSVS